jgi:hypothetical protein
MYKPSRSGMVVLCLACIVSSASAQLTGNVLSRILEIRTGAGIGTAFALDMDGRQYLVTAKHALQNTRGKVTIDFRESGEWSPLEVQVFPCEDPVDIAVLVPPRVLVRAGSLEPANSHNVMITQEVFFLGYPFGLSLENSRLLGMHPFPTAKRGIVSAIHDGIIEVDAYSNPGYSGAPIVFRDTRRNSKIPVFSVLGVVNGFYPEMVPVTRAEPAKPGEDLSHIEPWRLRTENGQQMVLRDTSQMVPLNSGILVAYDIEYALKVIRDHPVGPKVADK